MIAICTMIRGGFPPAGDDANAKDTTRQLRCHPPRRGGQTDARNLHKPKAPSLRELSPQVTEGVSRPLKKLCFFKVRCANFAGDSRNCNGCNLYNVSRVQKFLYRLKEYGKFLRIY